MKRLILMRHAKTEPWIEGIDDHGRALTATGRAAAQAMSLALAETGWDPDLVLVSTARRTRETWALLSPSLTFGSIRYEDDLYLASDRTILDIVADCAKEAGTLLVIGHNPGLHDLAVRLAREGGSDDFEAVQQISAKLPTGAVVMFEADEDGAFLPFRFKLTRFIRPRDLVA